MSKSGDQALQAQEAEALADSQSNPYAFAAPPESPRAVMSNGIRGARVGVASVASEAMAIDDTLSRFRSDMDQFSGTQLPDELLQRSDHIRTRLAQLRDSLALLCATYESVHDRVRPF